MAPHETLDGVPSQRNERKELLLLRQQGYRLTPQRLLILQLLQEAQTHLNVEELLEHARQHYPGLPPSTLYRTLELLEELQLVRGTYFPGEHRLRYEVFTDLTHHHLVCRKCRATIHLDEDLQKELYDLLQKRYGYHELILDVMSVGYCEPCWESRATKTLTPTVDRDESGDGL